MAFASKVLEPGLPVVWEMKLDSRMFGAKEKQLVPLEIYAERRPEHHVRKPTEQLFEARVRELRNQINEEAMCNWW